MTLFTPLLKLRRSVCWNYPTLDSLQVFRLSVCSLFSFSDLLHKTFSVNGICLEYLRFRYESLSSRGYTVTKCQKYIANFQNSCSAEPPCRFHLVLTLEGRGGCFTFTGPLNCWGEINIFGWISEHTLEWFQEKYLCAKVILKFSRY